MTPADTTLATRLEDAARNERLVLAESALQGERAMSVFRLMLFVSLGLAALATELGSHGRIVPYVPRLAGVACYAAFCVVLVWSLRRVSADPVRAFWFPFLASAVDFGFMTFMDWCDYVEYGRVFPTIAAIARAVAVSFAAARFAAVHVVYTVSLAVASYLGATIAGGVAELRNTSFAVSSFVILGLVIGWTSRRLTTMFAEVRRRDNLSRFLPQQVADRVLAHGEGSLAPVQREVTVLFADIRDFTALSEQLSPREVLRLLDEQLGQMARVVKEHEGVVNKFLGDGMLALWGVPADEPDHAALAVRAALALRAKIAELNDVRRLTGAPAIHVGIGVHTGVVAAGMLGGADQHEYTVIGDAVNVASRVEGLTKTSGCDILITDRTWELAAGVARGRRLGEESVKGRTARVVVYAVDGPAQ